MPSDLIAYAQDKEKNPKLAQLSDTSKYQGNSVHMMPICNHAYYQIDQVDEVENESCEDEKAEEAPPKSFIEHTSDSNKGITSGMGAI